MTTLTPEFLEKVYDIVRTHPDMVVLESFAQYGLEDKEQVKAALEELQRQERIMEWPMFAPPPERKEV